MFFKKFYLIKFYLFYTIKAYFVFYWNIQTSTALRWSRFQQQVRVMYALAGGQSGSGGVWGGKRLVNDQAVLSEPASQTARDRKTFLFHIAQQCGVR